MLSLFSFLATKKAALKMAF